METQETAPDVTDELDETSGEAFTDDTVDPADTDSAPSDDEAFADDDDAAALADDDAAQEGSAGQTDATAQEAPAASWEPTTPYTYQVGQSNYALDGALMGADGVLYIPPESVPEVSRLIAQGRAYETTRRQEIRQYQQQIADAQNQYSAEAVRSKATADFWIGLEKQGPEAILQFLTNWSINKPQLEAARQRAEAEAMVKQAQRMREGDPQEREEQATQQKAATVRALVQQTMAKPEYQFVAKEDWDRFEQRLWRNSAQLFTQADRDYLEHGVRKGQLIYRTEYFNDELQDLVALAQRKQQGQSNVTDAKQFNKQRNAPPKKGPSVAATASAGRTSAGLRSGQPKYKTRQDWQNAMYESMGISNPQHEAD